MNAMAVVLGYLALGLTFLVLSPLLAVIAAWNWWTYLRRGPSPWPFVPESKESFERWAKRMEQGRRIQEKEER